MPANLKCGQILLIVQLKYLIILRSQKSSYLNWSKGLKKTRVLMRRRKGGIGKCAPTLLRALRYHGIDFSCTQKMANMTHHILIKDYEKPDIELLFPLSNEDEEQFTLVDLQSAFPKATSLRYKDASDLQLHHVLCREGTFCVPEGGWIKDGREYFAVNLEENPSSHSRVERFNEYRQAVARNRGHFSNTRRLHFSRSLSRRDDRRRNMKVYLNVGIGTFSRGKFCKTAVNNSRPGGLVSVGPFHIEESTTDDIKEAVFTKFKIQNVNFRKLYKKSSDFVLVYPDGRLATTLPDSSEKFSIDGYRNFLDPKMKYDRLRLYLCTRDDYQKNTSEIEILTSASSDDSLPDIDLGSTSSSSITTKDESNMSKGIEVRFEWNVHIIRHFFPFESRVQNLIDYLHESPLREGNKMLTLINADKFLNPDDRLQPLLSGNSNIIEIAVEELEIGGNSNDNNDEQLELTMETLNPKNQMRMQINWLKWPWENWVIQRNLWRYLINSQECFLLDVL